MDKPNNQVDYQIAIQEAKHLFDLHSQRKNILQTLESNTEYMELKQCLTSIIDGDGIYVSGIFIPRGPVRPLIEKLVDANARIDELENDAAFDIDTDIKTQKDMMDKKGYTDIVLENLERWDILEDVVYIQSKPVGQQLAQKKLLVNSMFITTKKNMFAVPIGTKVGIYGLDLCDDIVVKSHEFDLIWNPDVESLMLKWYELSKSSYLVIGPSQYQLENNELIVRLTDGTLKNMYQVPSNTCCRLYHCGKQQTNIFWIPEDKHFFEAWWIISLSDINVQLGMQISNDRSVFSHKHINHNSGEENVSTKSNQSKIMVNWDDEEHLKELEAEYWSYLEDFVDGAYEDLADPTEEGDDILRDHFRE